MSLLWAAARTEPTSEHFVVHPKGAIDHRRHLLTHSREGWIPLDGEFHTDQQQVWRPAIDDHKDEMGEEGPEDPITVHEHPGHDGQTQRWVEDGHHRIVAAREAGLSRIWGHTYAEGPS